jgi:hypothetical protein
MFEHKDHSGLEPATRRTHGADMIPAAVIVLPSYYTRVHQALVSRTVLHWLLGQGGHANTAWLTEDRRLRSVGVLQQSYSNQHRPLHRSTHLPIYLLLFYSSLSFLYLSAKHCKTNDGVNTGGQLRLLTLEQKFCIIVWDRLP